MDIIFNCPHCDQELAVDSAGAGSEIQCPSCGETIAIPQESKQPVSVPVTGLAPSPISVSAAAKEEKHLKVPLRDKPGEILIARPTSPLKRVAGGVKLVRVRTIRHASCIEAGHDKFDEKVSEFLNQTSEADIIGIHTISYTFFDVGTQKILNDYGVLVVYRG